MFKGFQNHLPPLLRPWHGACVLAWMALVIGTPAVIALVVATADLPIVEGLRQPLVRGWFVMATVALVLTAWMYQRRRRLVKRSLLQFEGALPCGQCGYLIGSDQAIDGVIICPECGFQFDAVAAGWFWHLLTHPRERPWLPWVYRSSDRHGYIFAVLVVITPGAVTAISSGRWSLTMSFLIVLGWSGAISVGLWMRDRRASERRLDKRVLDENLMICSRCGGGLELAKNRPSWGELTCLICRAFHSSKDIVEFWRRALPAHWSLQATDAATTSREVSGVCNASRCRP
jgi:hypothetical protein